MLNSPPTSILKRKQDSFCKKKCGFICKLYLMQLLVDRCFGPSMHIYILSIIKILPVPSSNLHGKNICDVFQAIYFEKHVYMTANTFPIYRKDDLLNKYLSHSYASRMGNDTHDLKQGPLQKWKQHSICPCPYGGGGA